MALLDREGRYASLVFDPGIRHRYSDLHGRKVVTPKGHKYCAQCRKDHREDNPRLHWEWQLRGRWKMEAQDYANMFLDQDFQCGICKRDLLSCTVHIDHNHDTDVIRGLLCSFCNGAEGWLKKHNDAIYSWLERGKDG